MWLMLQQDEPDDYVVATGEQHPVMEYVSKSFEVVGLDWERYVKVEKPFHRLIDIDFMQSDCSKAKREAELGAEDEIRRVGGAHGGGGFGSVATLAERRTVSLGRA